MICPRCCARSLAAEQALINTSPAPLCLQVIVGEWLQLKDTRGAGQLTTASLVAGAALALLGTLCLASSLILVQAAAQKMSNGDMSMGKWVPMMFIALILALAVDGCDWSWLSELDTYGWAILLLFSLVSLPLSSLMVQSAVRKAGANRISVLISLRLVGSIIGERLMPPYVAVTGGLAIAGVVLIIVVVSGFFTLQVWLSSRKQEHAAASKQPPQ